MEKRIHTIADIKEAEAFLSTTDKKMADLIKTHGPCQISGLNQDLFTKLINSIVSQQLSVKAAETIFGRVLTLLECTELNPTKLAATDPDQLRSCGLSQAKTRYSLGLAKAAATGELDLKTLVEQPDEVIIDTLVSYPGIGAWTAEMFLIFAIGAPDVLSTADLGLKRGIMRYLELDDYPTDEDFIQYAERWRPYRSIASWYLWRLAE